MNYMSKALASELIKASEICKHRVEEEGGLILNRGDEFVFVPVQNIYKGTPTAAGLYETEQSDFTGKVFPLLKEGWKFYASFHTHPSFSPNPSGLDLNVLFQGFKHNYIYAPRPETFSYTTWGVEGQFTQYFNRDTLYALQ
jgi:proteasome lid subunit RPN8/RPN11